MQTAFYVWVFADKYLSCLTDVWQVHIDSLKRADLTAVLGEVARTSLVFEGQGPSREVALYTSHPSEVSLSPPSLVLSGTTPVRVSVTFRPVAAGDLNIKVNAVDVATREIVAAYLITTTTQYPIISKTFDVNVPRGELVSKKISYTNPYSSERKIMCSSSHSWLLRADPAEITLRAGETKFIGLRMQCGRGIAPRKLDALLFINEEHGKNEETVRLRVTIA